MHARGPPPPPTYRDAESAAMEHVPPAIRPPSGKPIVTITASAAASAATGVAANAAAAARTANRTMPHKQIDRAVNKVLDAYDWTLVPVPPKYVDHTQKPMFVSLCI